MSEEPKTSRRNFLKIGAGIVVAAAIAGGGYYWYLTSQKPSEEGGGGPPPEEKPATIRYLGYPFYTPQDAVNNYTKETGINVEVTYEDFFVLSQKQAANPAAWDVGASGRYRILVNQKVLKPFPVSSIERWSKDVVLPLFYNPEAQFTEPQAKRFNELIWANEERTEFIALPIMWNFDSVTYLPEFLPYEEEGGKKTTIEYAELWNPEWKGRAAMQNEAFTVFSETANYLDATGQISVANVSNLEREEVDQVYNFLLPIIKSGQIKTFWFKYGDIVSLMSTKEVYLASTWQPVCFDTRKAGTPAYYARLVHGPFFWYNSIYMSKSISADAEDEALNFINWHLSLYIQMLYTRQGYPTPAYGHSDYKNAMGDEFYDWFYNGKATYLPIDEIMKEIWPDKQEFWELEERLQQALFLPDVYFRHFWTGEPPRTGSPHPRGNLRDLGSVKDKEEITRYYLSPDLPDNNDYYVEKFEELKAQMPV